MFSLKEQIQTLTVAQTTNGGDVGSGVDWASGPAC